MIGLQRLEFEESDRALIRRFARQRDDDAFRILMGRYADMVYTTCRRILGNEAQAADAVQETFFQLVRNADRITGSLGSWLHRVATRRAVDLIRQNISRRRREEWYALEADRGSSTWAEVEPVVDEALEQLPEDLREVLMLHFLQGRSTIQIAAAQGVSQPTISRRMTEALVVLRQVLRERGIQAGLVPLQTVLLHSNHLAPEAVRCSLGKIALAKAVAANAAWFAAAPAPAAGWGVKAALTVAAALSIVATVHLARYERQQHRPAALSQPAAPSLPPNTAANAEPTARSESAPVPAVRVSARPTPPPSRVIAQAPRRLVPPRTVLPPPPTMPPPPAVQPEQTAEATAPGGGPTIGDSGLPLSWTGPAAYTAPTDFRLPYRNAYGGAVVNRGDIFKAPPNLPSRNDPARSRRSR